jgi:NADH:ubiquinone oxidoreductase subunit
MAGSFRVKRSGGPRTENGKAVAARNSLKTGMYATAVVLPHEIPADFEALNESLLVELGAHGLLEASLVREIAVVTWKRLRLDGLEGRYLSELLTRPETPEEFYEAGFPKNDGGEWALTHLDELTDEFIDLSRQCVIKAKNRESAQFPKGWATTLKQRDPEKFEQYMDMDRQQQAKQNATPNFRLQIVLNKDKDESDQVSEEVEKRLEMIVELVWLRDRRKNEGVVFVGERLEEIQRLKGVIRDRRLSDFLGEDRFQRGYEDLNRSLSRALRELRAQQAWRKKHEVIDVTPNDHNSKTD